MRWLVLILLMIGLAGCANPGTDEPHMSYGPPNSFGGAGAGMHFSGAGSFSATDEHYRSSTPPPFKGY